MKEAYAAAGEGKEHFFPQLEAKEPKDFLLGLCQKIGVHIQTLFVRKTPKEISEVAFMTRRRFLGLAAGTIATIAIPRSIDESSETPSSSIAHYSQQEIKEFPVENLVFPQYQSWLHAFPPQRKTPGEQKEHMQQLQKVISQETSPFDVSTSVTELTMALSRVDELITRALNAYGIQRHFDWRSVLAIMKVEAGFDENAESEAGAKRLGQLMDETSEDLIQRFSRFIPQLNETSILSDACKIALLLNSYYHQIAECYESYIHFQEGNPQEKDHEIAKKYLIDIKRIAEKHDIGRSPEELKLLTLFAYHDGANRIVRQGFKPKEQSDGARLAGSIPHLVEAYTHKKAATEISQEQLRKNIQTIFSSFGLQAKTATFSKIDGVQIAQVY